MSSFNLQTVDLPVAEIVPQVQQSLTHNCTLLVNAPPGAGKSTLLPLTLLNEPWLNGKKIIMLEPRRLAAKTIAIRMSALLGEQVGQTVGYRIRFETKTSTSTKLEVVTEGILTRMLQADNELSEVGLVIFDEFHERSLHADLALALCREAQQILRPDLRIMVMSATLNMQKLADLLKAPTVVSDGKMYPVTVKYTGTSDLMLLPELTAKQVLTALAENTNGDVLVFLPGEAEIKRTAELLQANAKDLQIHPLFGTLPSQQQLAAILPNKHGKRKVVLATNIAETSLTIEGVTVVIDCGLARISRFDPKSGLSRLETVQITQDSAIQRAGRAGRLAPGVCYRMYTQATFERQSEHRIPEIEEADLTAFMLELSAWGIHHVQSLTWLTPPPKPAVKMAVDLLHQLHALEDGKITPHGKSIHQLPCHPRIAHMLLFANNHHNTGLACDIAAILEERDPLPKDSGIDINLRIEALRRARANNTLGNKFARIEKNAAQYRQLLQAEMDNHPVDVHETGLLLAHVYPERIACARIGNNAQFQLANGKIATAGHRDDLAHEPWLAVAHLDARDGLGKIHLAAPLNPKDLVSMLKEKEVLTWDTRKGGLIAAKELRIGSIVLKSTPINHPQPHLIKKALINAVIAEGKTLLHFTETFTRLQHRILSLRKWNGTNEWPDVTTDSLLAEPELWLGDYLDQVKRTEDFAKIDLTEALSHWLGWDKLQLLEQLAPSKLLVPSGSAIPILYSEHGDTPVLAVRLQEVFGLAETPKINQGKMPVVLHLLSPGFKPVQVTSDLKSFWDNTYFEVKKELQRRYPKHAWPDEPWHAKAIAKGGVRN